MIKLIRLTDFDFSPDPSKTPSNIFRNDFKIVFYIEDYPTSEVDPSIFKIRTRSKKSGEKTAEKSATGASDPGQGTSHWNMVLGLEPKPEVARKTPGLEPRSPNAFGLALQYMASGQVFW